MTRRFPWPALLLACALMVSGCAGSGSDDPDGAAATSPGPTGTVDAATLDPLLEQAATDYKQYATSQIDELVNVVTVFTDAVRAGDLAAAQAAYAPSRVPWERIEPIAGLVEETDRRIDARVDDFDNVDDDEFTGWHRLEYLLFAQNTTDGAAVFADQLDSDVAALQQQFASVQIRPIDVANGAAELIEEISEGKITGEEDRYAKTDLWDFEANLQGARDAVETLRPALVKADPALLGTIHAGLESVFDTMRPLRDGDGWVLFCTENDPYPSPRCTGVTVDEATIDTLKAELAGLSEDLSQVAGVLDLR